MAARQPPPSQRKRRPGAGRPRKAPRAADAPDRPVAEDIVAAASRLFATQGVTATTMAEIAEASGLQVSSIYYYFGSKQAILERMLTEVNAVPLSLVEAIEADGGSPAARLHRLIRRDAAALCRFPFDINEVHRLAGGDDGTFSRYWDDRQRLNDEVERLVVEGVAAGQLTVADPRLAALTLLANDEAVQNWYRPVGARRLHGRDADAGGDYGPEEIGAFLADLALRGLLDDPGTLDAVRDEATRLGG